ncbi:uncharacterized protein PAN0_005c2716 [Moesziomyces antarcticus]|uniref:Uncharacterized protein n=1 Tax=Pseudozyma antarctica TaxID=84753 RepID=A0A081CCV6_PSEA2|nr:uncharacterized protein PAN0_005c2716 [Moesziomyces antarcticus]GAK64502.1 hypothetical protein PAN0_005c2716 [Moesziomyces antarcticus]
MRIVARQDDEYTRHELSDATTQPQCRPEPGLTMLPRQGMQLLYQATRCSSADGVGHATPLIFWTIVSVAVLPLLARARARKQRVAEQKYAVPPAAALRNRFESSPQAPSLPWQAGRRQVIRSIGISDEVDPKPCKHVRQPERQRVHVPHVEKLAKTTLEARKSRALLYLAPDVGLRMATASNKAAWRFNSSSPNCRTLTEKAEHAGRFMCLERGAALCADFKEEARMTRDSDAPSAPARSRFLRTAS